LVALERDHVRGVEPQRPVVAEADALAGERALASHPHRVRGQALEQPHQRHEPEPEREERIGTGGVAHSSGWLPVRGVHRVSVLEGSCRGVRLWKALRVRWAARSSSSTEPKRKASPGLTNPASSSSTTVCCPRTTAPWWSRREGSARTLPTASA